MRAGDEAGPTSLTREGSYVDKKRRFLLLRDVFYSVLRAVKLSMRD